MNQLSREQHLWIRFFDRTKYTLRQPIQLEQLGTTNFEKSICRAERLERIWSDEGALGTALRFWRETSDSGTPNYGEPVAIMGDYVIFRKSNAYSEQQLFTWTSARSWNGPPVVQIYLPLTFPFIESYMDLDTGIFYVTFPSDCGL